MPWKESCKMDERMKFIVRFKEGEKISHLCEEFGISRQTGHKLLNRYEKEGIEGLKDKRRIPLRIARKTVSSIEEEILRIKRERLHWGAAKIRELFIRRHPDIKPPAKSTFHAIFDRNNLVKKRKKRVNRFKATGTYLSVPKSPNDLWCADFKGEFLLSGKRRYCYPLTISDSFSRYLIGCEALEDIKVDTSFPVFERVFKEYGLPRAIRTDNGAPFSSYAGLFGLSRLSLWWLRLGIKVERIRPGHPEENGRHERIHRTIKKETTKPPGISFLQQQEKFDYFMEEYNKERPHEALKMKIPFEVYKPSRREYKGLTDLKYPFCEKERIIDSVGQIYLPNRRKVFISTILARQTVGLNEVDEGIWKVTFMDYDIGYFDEESLKFSPSKSPLKES